MTDEEEKRENIPAPRGNQTRDLSIISPMCYHLSYHHGPAIDKMALNALAPDQKSEHQAISNFLLLIVDSNFDFTDDIIKLMILIPKTG